MRIETGSHQKRWKIQEKIDKGGQGTVYLVNDLQFDPSEHIDILAEGLRATISASLPDQRSSGRIKAITSLEQLFVNFGASSKGALKTLNLPGDSPNPEKAEARAKREIQVLSECTHPNLLKLIDFDEQELWFVSKYYRNGTLDSLGGECKGQFCKVLLAVRPLVEAVAVLHQQSMVHRDIKPQNIFIGDVNELVLGDFGLVHFTDSSEARVTSTSENVGSWEWMPPWATDKRVEDLSPSFDVFSLAKVIWSLVSGKPFMRYWNFSEDDNNVENLYPDAPNMDLANELFSKCIVEKESDCLKDAGQLLKAIDDLLRRIARLDPLAVARSTQCNWCESGRYMEKEQNSDPESNQQKKLVTCNTCGHILVFDSKHNQDFFASAIDLDSVAPFLKPLDDNLSSFIHDFNLEWEKEVELGSDGFRSSQEVISIYEKRLQTIISSCKKEEIPTNVIASLNECEQKLKQVLSKFKTFRENIGPVFVNMLEDVKKRLRTHSQTSIARKVALNRNRKQ